MSAATTRRRTRRAGSTAIGLTAVLVLLGFGTAIASSTASPSAGVMAAAPATHSYTEDQSGVFPNPERGFESDEQEFQTFDDKDAVDFRKKLGPDVTLVHGSVDLSGYTNRDLDKPLLDGLSTAFAALRAHGLKTILRFTYSPKLPPGVPTGCSNREVAPPVYPAPGGVPPDAPIDIVQKQLQRMSGLLHQNVDVIAAFEAGFAGEFGEWHCSTNLLLSTQHIGQLVSALMTELPRTRQVAFRYPQDMFTFAPQYGRIGSHQDCYAAGATDESTWSEDPSVMAQQMQQVGAIGQHSIIGGTACALSSRTTCTIAALGSPTKVAELPEMHFSYFLKLWNPTALAAYSTSPVDPKGVNCFDRTDPGTTMQRQLGYRFTLRQATFADDPVPGQPLPVSITLANVGWASPYNERPAFLVLDGPTGRTQAQVHTDPRNWKAGQTTTVTASIPVPANATGTYSLSFWLPDEATVLRSGPTVADYSVRFANLDTWQQATGLNVLSSTIHVRASTSTTTTTQVATSTTSSPATTTTGSSAPSPSGPTTFFTSAPARPPELAATGTSPWPLVVGVLLIATGAGTVVVARRRR